jgi:hypothetical protein
MARDHILYKDDNVILDIARGNQTLTPPPAKSILPFRCVPLGSILSVSTGIKQQPAMEDKVMIAMEGKA